jgi:hypothetical protein
MTGRPRITIPERRARIATRHALLPAARVTSMAESARTMVALHGTDVASMYLQAWARMRDSSIAGIGNELYEDRTVLRMLAMRRTLFVTPVDEVATLHHAASLAVARTERARAIAMFTDAEGIGPDPGRLFAELEGIGLAAVQEQGEATTAELTRLDPRLALRIRVAQGKSYEGSISVSQRVFLLLALEGRIGRGRPRGSWKGTQVRWSPIERWLPDGMAHLSVPDAQARLVGSWLRSFGPGTRDDIRWWTGWTVAAVRAALLANRAVEVDLDGGGTGWVLPDDLDPVRDPGPWIAVLPALDATTMGWAERDWYLGPHRPRIFDGAGNGGPTIWVDGRIVGGWAQRPSGDIATSYLEDVGADARALIEAEVARLEAWLGAERFRTSFPTPLEVELRDA